MKTVLLLPLLLMMSVVLVCGAELEVGDFTFSGPLGSDGARIEKLGKNHFHVTVSHALNHHGAAKQAQLPSRSQRQRGILATEDSSL